MADLKYFIRESQRFRAGAGNAEEGMTVERSTLCISALLSSNGPNVHFRKTQHNGVEEQKAGCTELNLVTAWGEWIVRIHCSLIFRRKFGFVIFCVAFFSFSWNNFWMTNLPVTGIATRKQPAFSREKCVLPDQLPRVWERLLGVGIRCCTRDLDIAMVACNLHKICWLVWKHSLDARQAVVVTVVAFHANYGRPLLWARDQIHHRDFWCWTAFLTNFYCQLPPTSSNHSSSSGKTEFLQVKSFPGCHQHVCRFE